MNDMIVLGFINGVSFGIALSLLMRPAPNVTINNSVSLDPYDDDEDTDLVDDDDEGEAWKRSRN